MKPRKNIRRQIRAREVAEVKYVVDVRPGNTDIDVFVLALHVAYHTLQCLFRKVQHFVQQKTQNAKWKTQNYKSKVTDEDRKVLTEGQVLKTESTFTFFAVVLPFAF